MSEQTPRPQPRLDKDKTNQSADPSANVKSPPEADPKVLPSETKKSQELTAEEQMALYEKELKENDWGHQPC